MGLMFINNLDGTYVPGINNYCDDGNNISGDGCSSTCSVEFGISCINGNIIRTDYCFDICGDSAIVGNRSVTECDDGNFINGDGCDSTCHVEKDYACDGGSPSLKDRCWSNGFIGILLNDTVIIHEGYFTNDELGITLNNEIQYNSSISFNWKAYYKTRTIMIIKIFSNESLFGGKYSILNLDFKNRVMYSELLKLIDNQYSIQLREDPTKNKVGYILGIIYHIIFILCFVVLCTVLVADKENLCSIIIVVTTMQKIFMILLVNCRPSTLLASFWIYYGIVMFKVDYLNYLFKIQIDEADIAMSSHKYNSLGWFGFDTPYVISNSAGTLTILVLALFIISTCFIIFGLAKYFFRKGKLFEMLSNLLPYYPQILIILHQLIQNDLTISIFINFGSLIFSNPTEIYSSVICIILASCFFSIYLIPLGLISNNSFKTLMSDSFIYKAGVYYQSILKPPVKDYSFNFLSYYSVISMIYSVFFSIIIVSFGTLPYLQLPLITILNGVYLLFACFCPYNLRILNLLNIVNHASIFGSSLLMCLTLGVDSYAEYPMYAEIACGFILVIIFLTSGFSFIILYLRLIPSFIIGVKKGFKFGPIIHYSKEDKEVVAPEVSLPDNMNAGRIKYDESFMRRVNQTELAMTTANLRKVSPFNIEESKQPDDLKLKRKQIYADQAI